MDRLVVVVHSVKMPVLVPTALRTRCRQLENMADLKRRIIEIKAETNFLAHVLIIAIRRINKDTIYESCRKAYKIIPVH